MAILMLSPPQTTWLPEPIAAVSAAALTPALPCCLLHTTCRHSGPQGKVVPLTIIDDPADWRASELKPADYTYHLSPAEVAELIAATEAILARGVKDEEDIKKVRTDA